MVDNQDVKITGCDSTCQQLWSSRKTLDQYENIEYKSIAYTLLVLRYPVTTYGKGCRILSLLV